MTKTKKAPVKLWRVIRRDVFRRDVRQELHTFSSEEQARCLQYRLTVEQGGGGSFYEVEYT